MKIRNFALFLALLWLLPAQGQKKKEETVYYTDSRVKDSRFDIALNANPTYSTMRLINDDGSGSIFESFSEVDVRGGFVLDYGLDLFYELAPSFQIGLGFARNDGIYTLEGINTVGFGDTLGSEYRARVGMYSLPLKINFRSSISETFDLEVVPMLQLNFLQSYEAGFAFANGARPDTTLVLDDQLRNTNFTVGLALGGTFWLGDNWGLFTRFSINYMLNNPIEENWPRETLLSIGGNLGVRYRF